MSRGFIALWELLQLYDSSSSPEKHEYAGGQESRKDAPIERAPFQEAKVLRKSGPSGPGQARKAPESRERRRQWQSESSRIEENAVQELQR